MSRERYAKPTHRETHDVWGTLQGLYKFGETSYWKVLQAAIVPF